MKKFSRRAVLLLVILAFLFSVSLEKAEAQCPTGYNFASFSYTYNIPGGGSGTVIVTYCYICGVSSNSTIADIQTVTIDYSLLSYAATDDFKNVLNDQVAFNLKNLCTVPPCPQQSANFEISKSMCVKYVNQPANARVVIVFCNGDNSCKYLYTLCMDNTQSPPVLMKTLISKSSTGTPNCDSSATIPPNGSNWDDAWESTCFQYTCPN
ncbi:MAG: hypothetical protein NTW25_02550 [Candidatus Kapabacteria bacterium]|nr:hypothetical protein [Candidatus Kapabacteria bacterium]